MGNIYQYKVEGKKMILNKNGELEEIWGPQKYSIPNGRREPAFTEQNSSLIFVIDLIFNNILNSYILLFIDGNIICKEVTILSLFFQSFYLFFPFPGLQLCTLVLGKQVMTVTALPLLDFKGNAFVASFIK